MSQVIFVGRRACMQWKWCGQLLQMSHVAWSVTVCSANRWVVQ